MLRPRAGTVLLDGHPIQRLPPHRVVRSGVTLVPEGRQIFSALTVRENLEVGGYTQGTGAVRSAMERVLAISPPWRHG